MSLTYFFIGFSPWKTNKCSHTLHWCKHLGSRNNYGTAHVSLEERLGVQECVQRDHDTARDYNNKHGSVGQDEKSNAACFQDVVPIETILYLRCVDLSL